MAIRTEPRCLGSCDKSSSFSASAKNTLHVTDNRTGNDYVIPIVRNSISAMSFKQMKAPKDTTQPCDQTEYGIRVYDPGFGNTAVSESKITYKSVYWHSLSSISLIMVQRWFERYPFLPWLRYWRFSYKEVVH